MNHLNYPMEMRHPNFRPAVVSGYRRGPGGVAVNDPPGKPAMHPPIWVNNRDQELQYASLGYLPVGVGDAQKYRQEMLDADLPDVYHHQDYPKWLYRFTGALESILVKSADEHKAHGQWYASPDEAKRHFIDAQPEPVVQAEPAAQPESTPTESTSPSNEDVDVVADTPQMKARRGRPRKAA